jgi:hypothetical protein
MYWIPGNPNYVKIGYTCGEKPAERLKQWSTKCKHAIESFKIPPAAVSHVRRVEALIHAELKDVQCRLENCQGCGSNHREWFRDGPAHTLRVFRKWAEWMKTRPYAYVGGKVGTGMLLREDIRRRKIEVLCRPLERRGLGV